ncbi:MAG: NTP transferase domain-containing protein [Rhodospirillales bacterium]|jgi:molybdenum cofactor cytidylyltransferase|nr:NTP transferase domain-containing protein [Rhodospirillales bacterium]MBT4040632.1 NTP transferase domain-containing protein [Rhodospirillales bacterium]MBT4628135.1 NTP transferase domain-containing protein [Rhodospirillales bacterium]MBT5353110.1 NTP transferase domain-containing protein [Rhodospirillales bacterium]MBT5520797.1 NTP transferase domain-containing protein [Rhodospirillales bacterium]
MKFAEIPIDQANGAIAAHTVRLSDRVVKKGRYLDKEALGALARDGHSHVMAAMLEPGDVDENAAAAAIGAACAGNGINRTSAFTGRCNLISKVEGLLVVDVDALTQLNLVDEAITIASLAPFSVVRAGQLVATVKIIPFSVPQSAVDQACELIRQTPAVRVMPFQTRTVGLILTRLSGVREVLLDKAAQALETRLNRLDSTIVMERRCDHDRDSVAIQITELQAAGCDLIIIAGATATVDRGDTVPSGIVHAGGNIDHFGMPTDPGNLLLYGHVDEITVIGMPGCARSLKFNGFDQVLNRTMVGLSFDRADFARLGAGGLLEETPARLAPREQAVREPIEPAMQQPDSANITAIILAAGQSSRMGDLNKLLIDVDGKAMVRLAAEAAIGSKANTIVVVTGHEPQQIEQALEGLDVTFVHNPDFAEGMSTSLKCGLAQLPEQVDGALICLADMPGIEVGHLDRLIDAFDPELERAICVSNYDGRRGNPVLWGRFCFSEMMALTGDMGARKLLRRFGDMVCEVEMPDEAVLLDVDTPEALAQHLREN